MRPETPLLDRVNIPADMKGLSDAELHRLADELRAETIAAVSQTGGHLGAGLGVIWLRADRLLIRRAGDSERGSNVSSPDADRPGPTEPDRRRP